MKYRIKQSKIACIVDVNGFGIIYFSEDKEPGKWEPGDKIWQALPKVVKDAVLARFKEVYEMVDQYKKEFRLREFDTWLAALPELELDVPVDDVPVCARALNTGRLNPWFDPEPVKITLPSPIGILRSLSEGINPLPA